MDIIADEMGLDRIDLRRRNLLVDGDTFATGETMHSTRFEGVLDDALTLHRDSPEPTADERRAVGRGSAVIIKSTITPSTSEASVKLDSDGSLQVLTSTVEMGQGAHTALAQIAAGQLGIPTTSVHVVGPDTDTTPFDLTTSSSRSTSSMGAAVDTAMVEIREELMRLAADQLETSIDDLEIRDGQVVVRGAQVQKSIQAVVTDSRRGTLTASGTFMSEGGLDAATGQGIASEHWHQGAVAAEVEVDTATGKIHICRLRASVYAGTVVNPVNARMQIQGSVQFGVSQALFEQLIQEEGHHINANLSEYALAGLGDLPGVLEISLIEDPGSDEIHGLGETALPPVMPAIANAVADAVGVRILDLPLTAERVLDAIRAKEQA
jgi:CO/xanthine dehydrogenase Mo-binding subunit